MAQSSDLSAQAILRIASLWRSNRLIEKAIH